MSYELCKCKGEYSCIAQRSGCLCQNCGKIALEWSDMKICRFCGKDIMLHCESEEEDCFNKSRETSTRRSNTDG